MIVQSKNQNISFFLSDTDNQAYIYDELLYVVELLLVKFTEKLPLFFDTVYTILSDHLTIISRSSRESPYMYLHVIIVEILSSCFAKSRYHSVIQRN